MCMLKLNWIELNFFLYYLKEKKEKILSVWSTSNAFINISHMRKVNTFKHFFILNYLNA